MNKRIFAIMKKEMLHVIRDTRSLILAIAMPLLFLFMFAYALNFDINDVKMSVCDLDKSQNSREFIAAFTSSGYFTLTGDYNGQEDVMHSLDRSKSQIGIIIPSGFGRDLARSKSAKVQILVDGTETSNANIIIGYTMGITYFYSSKITLDFFNKIGIRASKNIAGIEGLPVYRYNPELRSKNFIIPGLIAVIMAIILAVLTSFTIVREKEKGTFEQLIVTPVKSYELMLGKIIPYWIIGLLDMWLIVLVGVFIYKVPLHGSLLFLFFVGGIFSFCGLGIGLLISSIVETTQAANQLSMMLSYLPAMILSGFLFPVKTMPKIIQFVSVFVPARYFLTILRGIFLKGNGWAILWKETLVLLFFGVVLIGMASLRFKKKLS